MLPLHMESWRNEINAASAAIGRVDHYNHALLKEATTQMPILREKGCSSSKWGSEQGKARDMCDF